MAAFVMLCIAFVVALVVLLKYFQYRQWTKQLAIPGPTPTAFIGNAREVAAREGLWLVSLDWIHQYGSVVQAFLLNRRWVVIGFNEEVLRDLYSGKAFIKGEQQMKDFEDACGKTSMIFCDGETWYRVRKICAGSFNISRLQMFVDPMHLCIDNLLKHFSSRISTPNKMQPIYIDQIFMHVTLDIIGLTMFSVDLQSLASGGSEFSTVVESYFKESFAQIVNPIAAINPLCTMRRRKAANFVREFTENVLQQRIHLRTTEAHHVTKDLLDLLLDAQDPDTSVGLTKDEVTDQTITFLMAGHETTAHSLSFAVASIAQHPHVAKLVYEEIDEVISKAPSGKLEYEHLAKLPYLTAVIKEAMRMYPVVPGIIRELDEDYRIGANVIPKGTYVALNVVALHYDPKLWKDPETFNPSRFMKNENEPESPSISSLSFAPFAHGRRHCIGQHFAMLEMKLVLASILHKFHFRMFPMSFVDPVQHITFRPRNLKMLVYERKI